MKTSAIIKHTMECLRRWFSYSLALLSMVSVTWGAPTVTSFYPADSSTDLPIDTKASAGFSEAMDPATLTDNGFTLSRFVGMKAITGGWFHSAALRNDSTVVAWGYNSHSQCNVPVGLSGVSAISAGAYNTVALKDEGTVVAWGYNGYGQSTVPADLSGVTAISAGAYHVAALKNDGAVVAWGDNRYGQTTVPPGLTGVTSVDAGWGHTAALQDNGTITAWGDNSLGQCSVPSGLYGVTAIAAGGDHTLALKSDGTVAAWGDNCTSQCNVPAGLSGVTAIAAGLYHSVALESDGTVVAWGDNGGGQRDVPAGLSGVTAIAAGGFHTMALKSDGTIVAWGYNGDDQITIPTTLDIYVSPVAGTVSYNEGTSTAIFTPSTLLELDTAYHAIVNTTVKNIMGVPLAASTHWSFTTGHDPVLAITLGGTGTGSVTYSGGSCPGTCTPSFSSGTDVTLTPLPAQDSLFTGWSGACIGTGECLVTMTGVKSVTATFTLIDTEPPDTAITGHPAEITNSSSATFIFTGNEPGCTFQCRLDGGNWEACSSPFTYAGLAHGSHSFDVKATDQGVPLRNTDPTPASFNWSIDSVAPVINHSLPTGTYAGPQTVTLSTNEPATVYYTLDGSVPTTESPVYSAPLAVAATTTLRCLGMDTAGNIVTIGPLLYTITYSLTVNRLGPDGGTIYSSPAGITLSSGTATALFDSIFPVTLATTSTVGSIFSGWSGACSNMGGCTVTMAADTSVTAAFTETAQAAYDSAPEGTTAIINVQSPLSLGALSMTRNVALILTGVFDSIHINNGVLQAASLTTHTALP